MKIEFSENEKKTIIYISILLLVILAILIVDKAILFQGFPSKIVRNVSFDYCADNHIIDCNSIHGILHGLITRPRKCCDVENRSYVIKDIYYSWETNLNIIRHFKDMEKARKCKEVAHLL